MRVTNGKRKGSLVFAKDSIFRKVVSGRIRDVLDQQKANGDGSLKSRGI